MCDANIKQRKAAQNHCSKTETLISSLLVSLIENYWKDRFLLPS